MGNSFDIQQSTFHDRSAASEVHLSSDTIAAISSAIGPGERMIVRTSGALSHELLRRLLADVSQGDVRDRQWTCMTLSILGMTVPAHALRFTGPKTFTGEDCVEYHLPGNPLLARRLLEALIGGGARLAEPGEFSARAYFNGRVDLAAAEGIAATIAAGNDRQLVAARQLAAGELSQRLLPATDALADALALLEAGIDFSDQDVSFIDAGELAARLDRVDSILIEVLARGDRIELNSAMPVVALVGKPNAGKSTLLNALAGAQRAVVSPLAGTTRDAISADVPLRRGIVRVVDTAGIEARDQGNSEMSRIRRAMQETARRTIERADVVVQVVDPTDADDDVQLARDAHIVVHSKADLREGDNDSPDCIAISAKTMHGMGVLREAMDRVAFGATSEGGTLALAVRHVEAIDAARDAIARARLHDSAIELVAADLRAALDHLGEVNGAITPDDVIGRVFSRFCIGK